MRAFPGTYVRIDGELRSSRSPHTPRQDNRWPLVWENRVGISVPGDQIYVIPDTRPTVGRGAHLRSQEGSGRGGVSMTFGLY